MALEFNGSQLPGFHERVKVGKPLLQVKRTKFAGINGESVITLGSGGRQLSCRAWVNSPAFGSSQALAQALAQFDALVGVSDNLVESGAVSQTFPDCTFEGFEPDGPLLPVVGGVGMNAGTWFVEGTFYWYQNAIV